MGRLIEQLRVKLDSSSPPVELVGEAEVKAADEAAEIASQTSRLMAKLYPLVEERAAMLARRRDWDAKQLKAQWEETFPSGVSAQVLADLWLTIEEDPM